jgi:hypothetical protein
MKQKFDAAIDSIDKAFSVAYKYELHAFVLLICGALLVLRGVKEEGFAVMGAALTIFKGKFGDSNSSGS